MTLTQGIGPGFNPTGGSWAPDGSIVFARDLGTSIALMRVPSAGGRPELLMGENPTAGENMRCPQVLPSGKASVYTLSTTDAPAPSIAVQPLSDGPRKIVVRNGYHGRYLPSGHFVYVTDGALFAVAFDPDRMEVTGPPARAIGGVTSNSFDHGGSAFRGLGPGSAGVRAEPGDAVDDQWIHRSGRREPLRHVPPRL